MLGRPPEGGSAFRSIPPLTAALFALNTAFFLAMAIAGGTESPAVLVLFGAKIGPLIEAGEWWRLVSSAFLHIGPWHFLLNVYALYLLGRFVERVYGVRRSLVIYAAGAAGGGALSTLVWPPLSAGAAGA